MREELVRLLLSIPKGKVVSYKLLADKLGTSPRAIGSMLKSNTRPVSVPCHRVVMSNGKLGGYKWGADSKRKLLLDEGVIIARGRVDKSCFADNL